MSFEQDVARLYNAAFDDAALAASLVDLARHNHSSVLNFLAFDAQSGAPVAGITSGDPSIDAEFRTNWAHRDKRIVRGLAQPRDRVWHQADLYTDDERRTCPVYNEWLKSHDAQAGMGIMTHAGPHLLLCSTAFRPENLGNYTKAEVRMWETLHLHLMAIVRLRQQFVDRTFAHHKSTADMQQMLYLDRDGQVIDSTTAARRFIADTPELSLQFGRLFLGRNQLTRAFDMRVQNVLAGDPVLPLALRTLGNRPVVSIDILRAVPAPFNSLGTRHAEVMVVLKNLQSPICADPREVAEVFGLTPTEAEIACALARGDTPSAIARQRNRALSTVRWTIRNILDKLELNRTCDLRALINGCS
ncbi:helix-turn-helix transcriptional regulator [Tateyamaria omphalii]|uniref:HTH luxR-type domain-containing protein n=1 Tax=Tateyamaria omphalii TaxID=299262 RepID=A0A1P8MSR2_9RHOB|nr:helix-turn-helix transcriptional regulator [Tateyamaria omphalii]APX11127.1 hypothetical protein BWR18_05045 [Tateyamaria omphalii]